MLTLYSYNRRKNLKYLDWKFCVFRILNSFSLPILVENIIWIVRNKKILTTTAAFRTLHRIGYFFIQKLVHRWSCRRISAHIVDLLWNLSFFRRIILIFLYFPIFLCHTSLWKIILFFEGPQLFERKKTWKKKACLIFQ